METQKIVNLLNDTDNGNSKFATKKWYVINNESKGNYSSKNEFKFFTSSLESSLCDYSGAYISVTGNTTVTGGNANTKVAFKSCAHLKIAEQKSMTLLLIMQQILILQCLRTIWLRIVTIILIHLVVYGSLKEMS